jgi:hypothetical protein
MNKDSPDKNILSHLYTKDDRNSRAFLDEASSRDKIELK